MPYSSRFQHASQFASPCIPSHVVVAVVLTPGTLHGKMKVVVENPDRSSADGPSSQAHGGGRDFFNRMSRISTNYYSGLAAAGAFLGRLSSFQRRRTAGTAALQYGPADPNRTPLPDVAAAEQCALSPGGSVGGGGGGSNSLGRGNVSFQQSSPRRRGATPLLDPF